MGNTVTNNEPTDLQLYYRDMSDFDKVRRLEDFSVNLMKQLYTDEYKRDYSGFTVSEKDPGTQMLDFAEATKFGAFQDVSFQKGSNDEYVEQVQSNFDFIKLHYDDESWYDGHEMSNFYVFLELQELQANDDFLKLNAWQQSLLIYQLYDITTYTKPHEFDGNLGEEFPTDFERTIHKEMTRDFGIATGIAVSPIFGAVWGPLAYIDLNRSSYREMVYNDVNGRDEESGFRAYGIKELIDMFIAWPTLTDID